MEFDPSQFKQVVQKHRVSCDDTPGMYSDDFNSMLITSSSRYPLIKGIIPKSVVHIQIVYDFSEPLEPGVIPNTVKSMGFIGKITQPLAPSVIPSSVTHVAFRHKNRYTLDPSVLPDSVLMVVIHDGSKLVLKHGSILLGFWQKYSFNNQ